MDKVKPLKLESADTGGEEDDAFPNSLDPHEDHVECRGVVLDDSTNQDESTVLTREGDDMLFRDGNNPSYVTLTELLNMGMTGHKALRHLIHFIDDGPADGFPSGAYSEILPVADPFPTSQIWWESSAKLKKIVELVITRNANKTPATEEWKMYDTDGVTVNATVSDSITYSGIFETSRTRVVA